MANSSNTSSNQSIEEILKDLEKKFGASESQQVPPTETVNKERSNHKSNPSLSPNLLTGTLVFMFLVVGVASAMWLGQRGQDIRQQASVDNGLCDNAIDGSNCNNSQPLGAACIRAGQPGVCQFASEGTSGMMNCRCNTSVPTPSPTPTPTNTPTPTPSNTPTPSPTPTNTPSPTPSPSPTSAPICLSLTMSPPNPRIDDSVTFTCGNVAGAFRYEFRITLPAGNTVSISPSTTQSNISQSYSIIQSGSHRAQCRICTGLDTSTCQAWEE